MFNSRVLSARPSGFWLRLFSLGLFLLLWAVIAAIADSSLLPGPWEVARYMVEPLREGDLLYHTGVTLARVAVAFVVSMIIGTVIGIFITYRLTRSLCARISALLKPISA